MKRLIKKAEFLKDINFNGNKTVLVYKNPTGREVDDIINEGAKSLRVFVDSNGDTYCWDSETSHEDMKSKLNCSDAVRLNIVPGSNMDIYITSEITSGTKLLSYLSKANLSNYKINDNTEIYINTDTYNAEWQDCYNGDTYGELMDDLENYEDEDEVVIEPILNKITDKLGGFITNNYDGKILVNDLVRIDFDNEGTYFSVHTPVSDDDYYASNLNGGIGGSEAMSIISNHFQYHPVTDIANKYSVSYEVCSDDNESYDFSFEIDGIQFENNQDATWKCKDANLAGIAEEANLNVNMNNLTLDEIDQLIGVSR